jgi:hypothetical protein
MSFSSLFKYLEFISVFVFSFILFFYFPISTIIFLFLYSVWRDTYYLLLIFTFVHDLMLVNTFHEIPKLTITIILLSVVTRFVVKNIFHNIRYNKYVL